MSSHIESRLFAATRRTGQTRWYGCLLIITTLAVEGCVSAPPRPLGGRDAADPDVAVAPMMYRSAFGIPDNVQPSEPTTWGSPDGTARQLKRDGS
jgi:hypothetical protein